MTPHEQLREAQSVNVFTMRSALSQYRAQAGRMSKAQARGANTLLRATSETRRAATAELDD